MQLLSFLNRARRPRRPFLASNAAVALAAAAAITSLVSAAGAAEDCPWMVLPASQSAMLGGGEPPVFDIVFDGPSYQQQVFYGFTVASLDLAWQLAERRLPELQPDGRRLEPIMSSDGIATYRLAPDTIEPHTIYLVAARSEIDALEEIDARIEPAAPIAVSQLMPRIRGGGEFTGPLPPVVQGFEVASASVTSAGAPRIAEPARPAETEVADWQICAYEVALR